MGRDDDYNRLLGGLAEAFAEPERKTVPDLHLVPPLPFAGEIGLAAIRRKSGLSQPAFARRIGVPLATLRNWEQGRRPARTGSGAAGGAGPQSKSCRRNVGGPLGRRSICLGPLLGPPPSGLSCPDPAGGLGRVIAIALAKLLQGLLLQKDLP